MINESKQGIKDVFDSFDKDKSGYVEQTELIAIAKELNQEISQQDVDRLMKVVDANKDGKIQFHEFWDWWQYGKNGKLEKLVFMKLNMMNLLKKVNVEFTRQGAMLSQKYNNDNRDHHYFALNYGDSRGDLRLKANIIVNGVGVQEEINKVANGIEVKEKQSIQILVFINSQEPEKAKVALQEWFDELIKVIQSQSEDVLANEELQFLNGMIGEWSQNTVQIYNTQDKVVIQLELAHPIFLETLQDYIQFIQSLGENLYVRVELICGIKNGLLKLIDKDTQFVKWLLEGFVLEAKFSENTDLIKKLIDTYVEQWSKASNEKNILHFLLLLKSSKFHLCFKNMDDVDSFFRGMGLDSLLSQQPTGRELIEELVSHEDAQNAKDSSKTENLLYKLASIFNLCCEAEGQVTIILPFATGTIEFQLQGLGEVMNCAFRNQ